MPARWAGFGCALYLKPSKAISSSLFKTPATPIWRPKSGKRRPSSLAKLLAIIVAATVTCHRRRVLAIEGELATGVSFSLLPRWKNDDTGIFFVKSIWYQIIVGIIETISTVQDSSADPSAGAGTHRSTDARVGESDLLAARVLHAPVRPSVSWRFFFPFQMAMLLGDQNGWG